MGNKLTNASALLLFTTLLAGCEGNETEKKVNEKEKISGVNVVIWHPVSTIEPVFDAILNDDDGDGIFEPDEFFPTAILSTDLNYGVYLHLFDMAEEINDEKDDHLVCFTSTNNVVSVSYLDKDSKDKPFGLSTQWTTGSNAVNGQITISLRHQPGVKTGNCPGDGESDFEIVIPIEVRD